jgi:hypothetical protein
MLRLRLRLAVLLGPTSFGAGGNGRFKMGLNSSDRIKAIELYGAIGEAYGLSKVGDGDYNADATVILA